ncbi:MAG: recombination regulator RecX [Castellaniella sp.]|uniref:recombination regulator RecX n=1 Tax=Castellaniella sp. TaxID=1955812 RepID=UPI002A360600|nr:recombination regulator RecX [Castellaniella sp.]MDY0309425.1 recombination regulator RecX [Castellaniella sp.]
MGNRTDGGFSTGPGGEGPPGRGSGGGPSLKARAVAYLSRREHSRLELQRKLSAWCDDPAAIEAVLDDLAREHWQSDQRYAQAYAHRAAERQGAQRILSALRQQGVADEQLADLRDTLNATEAERARAVWQRKFGHPPADPREYARQYRFMAGRGFSADCIRRLLDRRGHFDADVSSADGAD